MMKSGTPTFVVDSVERAVKFYTEKLAFDVANLEVDPDAKHVLSYAEVRKGKCYIGFRVPSVEELAEFSLIKRCGSRGAGLYVPMRRGLDRYFARCQKRGIIILQDPEVRASGERTFTIKDIFGIKLTFAEPLPGIQKPVIRNFAGFKLEADGDDETIVEQMIKWVKGFGILRRAAKKYARQWLKDAISKK